MSRSISASIRSNKHTFTRAVGVLYPLTLHPTKYLLCSCALWTVWSRREKVRVSRWRVPGVTTRQLPDSAKMIETNGHFMLSLMFSEDGKQVLGGGCIDKPGSEKGMLQRWRVDDGQEVGEPIRTEGAAIFAVALSPDRRWLVGGLGRSDSGEAKANVVVWNAQTHEKVLDIDTPAMSLDISPDSTTLATGSIGGFLCIWSITTGEGLVGPLSHDEFHSGPEFVVVAVRFSPVGDRIATASGTEGASQTQSIRIFNSKNGQQLVYIPCQSSMDISIPLAWSADGRQLFAATSNQVKRFDTFSGSLLSSWSVPGGGSRNSIVLSRNQRFVAILAHKSLSFWDVSTEMQIGTVIDHASEVASIALSPNDDYISTGEVNGIVTLRNLSEILPRSYLTPNVSSPLVECWQI